MITQGQVQIIQGRSPREYPLPPFPETYSPQDDYLLPLAFYDPPLLLRVLYKDSRVFPYCPEEERRGPSPYRITVLASREIRRFPPSPEKPQSRIPLAFRSELLPFLP